jgi:hypothetical protein
VVTLISTLGGGTVLSVGSGYGTNFSTITTSGSVVVDSLVITSRASRDKLKDSLNANIALKVNISDTATMLGAYLRKADTTAMLTPYLRKGDTATMLSPYVRTAGYGLLKGTQTLSVDSALMATRARVQKGIDSVASLVAAPDSLLFSTRAWRQKGDDSLGAIIGTKATATGTTNYLSKFTGTSSLGNSIVYATTSEVGISTPSPTHPLDVNGRVRVRTIDSTATGMNMLYADVDGVIKKTAVPAGGTVTSVATGFGLSGGTITTTGTLVADTNSMATRARVQKAVDSLQVNINAKGSGTVTSVAAGTGMSFTTITSTGSVAADTVALSTRAWRQKGIDSVQANVALKVNISDTATMLSPYVRAAGFGLTKSGQSLLVDSATMATRARVQKGIDSVAGLSRVTGSGTTNRVAKFTASGAVGDGSIADSSTSVAMTIMSNGNIGVGGIPTQRFHVLGGNIHLNNTRALSFKNASGTDRPVLTFFSDNNLYIDAEDGAQIFRTLGNERMRLTSTGDLLIGTTTTVAGYKLQVAGSIYNTTGAVLAASSGNVGIGTASPAYKFDVNGEAQITGNTYLNTGSSTNTRLAIGGGGLGVRIPTAGAVSDAIHIANGYTRFGFSQSFLNIYGRIGHNGNSGGFEIISQYDVGGNEASGNIRFITGANTATAERMRITHDGNVGIGTNNPTEKLEVNGNIKLGNNIYINSNGSVYNGNRQFLNMGTSGTARMFASSDTAQVQFYVKDSLFALKINADKEVYINPPLFSSDYGNYKLQVLGHVYFDSTLTVKKIDSTANAINMLYADANGVIKKTAVPASSVAMSTDNMTAASGWTIAYDKTEAHPVNDVNKTVDGSIATVTINTAAYRTTATFNTDQWVHVATVPAGFRPESDVYFSLPNTVAGASFRSTSSVGFTSYNFYQEETAIRVLPSGNVEVFVGLVSNSADLSGANYVIMPIAVTYNIETYPN